MADMKGETGSAAHLDGPCTETMTGHFRDWDRLTWVESSVGTNMRRNGREWVGTRWS